MLRPDVVEAVAAQRFHVYAVATVDDAVEILAGLPAGKPDGATGVYPAASVNGRVARRLGELAAMRGRAAQPPAPKRKRLGNRK
jgi:hypothetical protein